MDSYFDKEIDINELNGKQVFVYGASVAGIALLKYFKINHINVAGFSDTSFDSESMMIHYFDAQVLGFENLLQAITDYSTVFLCCSLKMQSEKYKRKILQKNKNVECVIIDNPIEVYIDISGQCNLRCRSCQVSNHHPESFSYSGRGQMSFGLFCEILDKIQKELPDCLGVFLFNFGEPLLSDKLPDMICELHRRGMIAVVSSNLSLEYDFIKLIKSEPDILKISVSGFTQKIYQTTHNGGNVYLVKSNMYRIKMLIDQYKSNTNVVVGYHVYANNGGSEYTNTKALCDELGFLFQPRRASFCNIPKQTGIDRYSDSDIEFITEYYPNSKDILSTEALNEPMDGICRNAVNRLFIDYNGDVFLCFLVMHKAAIYRSYLQTPLSEIREWQQNHWICKKCKQIGLASIL